MFLKRISAVGFKSFCDRVDFDFDRGITCIVGPNGCGKSNVVDALKWVLGEQSAKSLRGRQMADMIFNGSSARKSSSVAQVNLIFDNSSKTLPIDHEEVTVTRKLYRSGESEYLLNNEIARLKDIRELFLDTGIGVEAYSIIEQGKVDSLLQSNPIERRVIFEEAAGISRYKARRREAERRLERTQQNLLRVADVIEELEKRLRSVKLQAGKARSYLEYEARLRELRSTFAMAEYHRLTLEASRYDEASAKLGDQGTALRATIDRHEAKASSFNVELDRFAERIGLADNQLVQTRADLSAQEERITAANHRIQEQTALMERSRQRAESDQARLEQTNREIQGAQNQAEQLRQKRDEIQQRVELLTEQDRALARELTEVQAALEDEKSGIIELLRKSAQTHNEIVRLNTHRESLVDRKGRLFARDAQLREDLEKQLAQKVELEGQLVQINELIEQETQKLEQKKQEAARINALRQELIDRLAGIKEHRSALQSRHELLADLERRMEGVGTGARRILDACREGDGLFKPVQGLVAQHFDVDVEHASVIDAALGLCDQYLVVTDTAAFLSFLRHMDALPERVSAICMDRVQPLVNARDFSTRAGFVARALDWVRFAPEMEPLARHLFGKTIVVDRLETALQLKREDAYGHRFVTLRGEVVESDGCLRVGPESVSAGLISRKSELKSIGRRLADLDEQIVAMTDQLNRTQAEATHVETLQQELRTAVYESNAAKIEVCAAHRKIVEALERLSEEQPLIAREVELIEQQIREVLEKSDEGNKSLETLEQQNKERERRVEQLQQRIDDVVERRRAAQEALTQAKVEAGQITEKRAAVQETIGALTRTIQGLEAALTEAGHDCQQCEARIADARELIDHARDRIRELTEQAARFEADAAVFRQKREAMRLELEETHKAVKDARGELESLEAALHEHQMALAEVKVRRDDLVARVAEELKIDLATQYADYDHQEQNWEQVEAQIAELRVKMERLGHVNLGAIDELTELEERHRFLTSQRDDLNESHRQLTQLIDQLNRESIKRFRDTLEQVREHFRTLFRRLFGGGRADIILEDPENILECGIEIVAQPPGKELRSISLMSGGEKSMTAIALLMSIFKSRPAPFAILDEVDAALDEANNDRFNRIVHEFSKDTQFIIITHSKWTMNTADRLYGITMQEPGVSTRVGVEFTGIDAA